MFEYDYITKPINGYRFLVIGDEHGVDSVVGYVTPNGKIHRCSPKPANESWLRDWVVFELSAA